MSAPSDDDLVTTWGLLLEATAAAGRRLAADLEEGFGLSPAEAEVLFRLARTPGHVLTTTRLAREVSFSSGGFTRLADRLVAAGLVERQPCASDRRVVYAALTEQGRLVAAAALALHAEGLRLHVLDVLGPDEIESLAKSMRALRDHHRDDELRDDRRRV
ncbi:MAG: marR [Acidimicrobiaceae bacterium]|nr:marR [Acidimicrobiaceae bacterium]